MERESQRNGRLVRLQCTNGRLEITAPTCTTVTQGALPRGRHWRLAWYRAPRQSGAIPERLGWSEPILTIDRFHGLTRALTVLAAWRAGRREDALVLALSLPAVWQDLAILLQRERDRERHH